MQAYLKSNLFYQEDTKVLFRLISQMLNVKRNTQRKYEL